MCIGTLPRIQGDMRYLGKLPKAINHAAALFDGHPELGKFYGNWAGMSTNRTTWSWKVDSSMYGEPHARARLILVSSRLASGESENMEPQYVFAVRLPTVISEFMRVTREFRDGPLRICPSGSTELYQTAPMGWLNMHPGNVTMWIRTKNRRYHFCKPRLGRSSE